MLFSLNKSKVKPNWHVDLIIIPNHSNKKAWSSEELQNIKTDIKIQEFAKLIQVCTNLINSACEASW